MHMPSPAMILRRSALGLHNLTFDDFVPNSIRMKATIAERKENMFTEILTVRDRCYLLGGMLLSVVN
jgi:hypothetical protein